ncbi:MAG: PqiC family protein [Usitatibacter sp.]
MRTSPLLCLLLVAACSSPIKENYYTLSGPQSPAPAGNAASISVFVGPVTVPEAVDRLAMVLRTSPNQVEISDSHLWAEPLKSAIPRALAETLMRELGTPNVRATRAGATPDVDYRVTVEVQRFDSSTQSGATLDALWSVAGKGKSRTGRSTYTEPAADPAGLAAAHSRALERLGRDIAAAIKGV